MSNNGHAYNSRLQKGGALLDDMRLLVRNWSEADLEGQRDTLIAANLLGKDTRARSADTYRYAFHSRFVEGNPPKAWRIVRELENRELPLEILRPVYYWITARSERLLYDFVCDELVSRSISHDQAIRTDDTSSWITTKLAKGKHKKTWSSTVTTRVARGILACLRDFGILEGAAKKRVAPIYVPVESFAYIAFALHQEGASGHALVSHHDWLLFLFSPQTVEHLLVEADRHGLLRYQSAGRIVRIDFPAQSFKEMADVVAAKAH